jgi:hypothetical protein
VPSRLTLLLAQLVLLLLLLRPTEKQANRWLRQGRTLTHRCCRARAARAAMQHRH